jgi:glycolate oxidase iron-sulfur subunit
MSDASRTTPTFSFDRDTMAQADACVHCGLCLPACPTYTQNGLEADSPRGRIHLMKSIAEGRIDATDNVVKHLDLCLDCRACEPACPSGVVYHQIIEEARTQLARQRKPKKGHRLVRRLMFHVFTRPRRLKAALILPRLLQKLRLWQTLIRLSESLLPEALVKLQRTLPETGPVWETRLARRYPADGKAVMTVGLFEGCVSSVLEQDLNRKLIDLLRLGRCEIVVPRRQRCCGAIDHHGGRPEPAKAMAKRNIAAFESVDVVVTGVAGCGAMLKDYPTLLRDEGDWADRAAAFVAKVHDASTLLADLDLPEPASKVKRIATYHDACHLAHAQGVRSAPRQLLARIDGLTIVPLAESDICCGAAGTYNLDQPGMSRELAERKLRNIQQTDAALCITGNIGCALQIKSESKRLGIALDVCHPVDVLHEAYFGRH